MLKVVGGPYPGQAGVGRRLSLATILATLQDDSRVSHDALPERTVIQLDSSPR